VAEVSALDFFSAEELGVGAEFDAKPSRQVTRHREVMLDLETMSLQPNAAVIAIGAVTFDLKTLTLGERFYTNVDLVSCQEYGLHIDAGTVKWWLSQSEDARKGVTGKASPLSAALQNFAEWLEASTLPVKERCIWGNGANFDPVVLEQAYVACSIEVPWKFWGVRCFRTLKNLWPHVEADKRQGTHHNALDDAVHQVEHIFKIRRTLRGNKDQ
jgi:exodeoxyribonuclease VIII